MGVERLVCFLLKGNTDFFKRFMRTLTPEQPGWFDLHRAVETQTMSFCTLPGGLRVMVFRTLFPEQFRAVAGDGSCLLLGALAAKRTSIS